MNLRQSQFFVVTVASLILSGCYVYATVPPAPNGPAVDERLIGAWVGLDEKGKAVPNAFLHVTKPKDGGPMHVVVTETDNFAVNELHIAHASGKRFFALRKVHPAEPAGSKLTGNTDDSKYMLGAYDIRGNTLVIRILVPEKLKAAVVAGKVKGQVGSGEYAAVTLTGSPDEVTRFLASPEADAALSKPYPLARRLPQPR